MRFLCALCISALAWAGPNDSAEAYRAEVAKQAALDNAAGARALVKLWSANEAKIAPLRKDIARLRAKRTKEDRKLRKERDERKRSAIRTRIAELVDDYIEVDRRLSPLELRRVDLLHAIDGLKSKEAIGWLCTEGLGRIRDREAGCPQRRCRRRHAARGVGPVEETGAGGAAPASARPTRQERQHSTE